MHSNQAEAETPGVTEIKPEATQAPEKAKPARRVMSKISGNGRRRRHRQVYPATKAKPLRQRTDELLEIDQAVTAELGRFGINPEQVKTKRTLDKVRMVMAGAFGALDRIHKAVLEYSAKVGAHWATQQDLSANLNNLLSILHSRARKGPDAAVNDQELLRIATLMNSLVEFQLTKLPDSGAEALRLVLPLLEQQVRSSVKASK